MSWKFKRELLFLSYKMWHKVLNMMTLYLNWVAVDHHKHQTAGVCGTKDTKV